MSVYYKIDEDYIYYTNEEKTGYTLWQTDAHDPPTRNKIVIIELYEDKFVLPRFSVGLFLDAANETFNDMDKWDTSEVESMWSLFQRCENLTSVDVSHFDTSHVGDMDYMFSSCSSLRTLDLSSFDMSSVYTVGGMFWGCENLEYLDLRGWDVHSFSMINRMFEDCHSLHTIYVNNDTDWAAESGATTTYGWGMFTFCYSLLGYSDTSVGIDKANDGPNGYFKSNPRWIEHDVFIKTSEGWIPLETFY